MISINTNAGAILAANAAKNAAVMMDEAMTRLSTGKRLNSAKDDPAAIFDLWLDGHLIER